VAEEKKPSEKTLEMRVAAIEDMLAKLHITEEEMRAYEKVSNLLANPARGHCYQPPVQPDYPPQLSCYCHLVRPSCSCSRPACYECFRFPCSCYGGGGFGGFGS
jgi:hypothetical protein